MQEGAAVTVRAARAEDAREAGPIVFEAAPTVFCLLLGPSRDEAVRALTRLFALGGNPFGFELARVAVRDGCVVGVVIAASARARRRAGRVLWWLLPRVRGPLAALRRLPETLAMLRGYASPPPEAYYVGILAVAAEHRGQGVGRRLLGHAAEQARAAGCALTLLHVEMDHEDTLRFYRRAGFRETACHVADPRLARRGIAGFVTMERKAEAADEEGTAAPGRVYWANLNEQQKDNT